MTRISTWYARLPGTRDMRELLVRKTAQGTARVTARGAARWAARGAALRRNAECPHRPPCPTAKDHDRTAARVVSRHPEQGWSLLCNGVIVFDDAGELLPDGHAVAAHRHEPVAV